MRLPRPRSLFGQLTFWHAILLITAAGVLILVFSALLKQTAESFVEARLRTEITRIAGSLSLDPPSSAQISRQLGPLFDRDGGSMGFAVLDRQGKVLANGGVDFPIPQGTATRLTDRLRIVRGFYELQGKIHRSGQDLTIVVAQDMSAPDVLIDDVVIAFLAKAWWILLALFAAMLATSAWVSRQIANRLRLKARMAEAISREDLETRIDPAGIPDEVAPLVKAANSALDRLAAALRDEAEFVGNVSHELRTPLSTLAMLTEQIDDDHLRSAMQRTIARSSHVIEQLLALTGVESANFRFEKFDLVALATEAALDISGEIYRSGRSLELDVGEDGPMMVAGHPGLIRTVVENLIRNAIAHTPKGTHIILSVGPGPEIAVLDDGPGIAEADLAKTGQRHWRAETRNDGGAGLGLAICGRIATVHGARFEAYRRSPKGTRFVFRLPPKQNPHPVRPL
ncbi:MAG: HAMP domain-containing histidine kinase [Proteobacteria bacterium]|nr:HAMP domain-containing histidine kinase [Pseudomonadota bacterium]